MRVTAIGINPLGVALFGPNLAQTRDWLNAGLVFGQEQASVDFADRRVMVQRSVEHTFRTPSLIGQVCVTDADLPDFFQSNSIRCARNGRISADPRRNKTSRLRNRMNRSWVSLSSIELGEGINPCANQILSPGYRLHLPCVAGWQPVATTSANRHCLVRGPVRSDRPRSAAVLSPVRRLALRPTSSIANKIRANVPDVRARHARQHSPACLPVKKRPGVLAGVHSGQIARPTIFRTEFTHPGTRPELAAMSVLGAPINMSKEDSTCSKRS